MYTDKNKTGLSKLWKHAGSCFGVSALKYLCDSKRTIFTKSLFSLSKISYFRFPVFRACFLSFYNFSETYFMWMKLVTLVYYICIYFFCSVNCTSGCLKCPSIFCVREAYVASKTVQIFLTTKHFITIRLEWMSWQLPNVEELVCEWIFNKMDVKSYRLIPVSVRK